MKRHRAGILGLLVVLGLLIPFVTLQGVATAQTPMAECPAESAGTLSGGEQQMLAIGRGLMLRPVLLMLDEPSLGLAPKLVDEIFATIRVIADEGMTILLVEQNVRESLELADRAYALQTGRTVLTGTGEELLDSDLVREAYLGL